METLCLDRISIVSTNLAELRDYFINILVNPGTPILIITFNLEIYRNALINFESNLVCQKAELVLPDGIGITHLLKLKYKKKINRITGSDLFELILNIASEKSLSVAFVGSSEKVIRDLSAKVTRLSPMCRIVAAISPSSFSKTIIEENNQHSGRIEKGKT